MQVGQFVTVRLRNPSVYVSGTITGFTPSTFSIEFETQVGLERKTVVRIATIERKRIVRVVSR